MAMRLEYPGRVPYGGGYVIDEPDLGVRATGTEFGMLLTNACKYRNSNGLPIGLGFADFLEQLVCQKYPKECKLTDDVLPLERRLNLGDVIRGTKVLVSFKMAGSPFVPREEAQRRASICSKCQLCKPFPRTCAGMCGEIKEAAMAIIGPSGYTTSMDHDERACSICFCFAAGHIRFPYEHLAKGITEEMKTQFQRAAQLFSCWKTEGAI